MPSCGAGTPESNGMKEHKPIEYLQDKHVQVHVRRVKRKAGSRLATVIAFSYSSFFFFYF